MYIRQPMSSRSLFVLLLLAVTAFGCRKEHFKPTWETQWLAPLFNTDLSLGQLLGDTLLQSNADGSIQLVYHNTVYEFDPNANAINIPDTSVRTSYNVNALTLSNQAVDYPYSMGKFAQQLGLIGQIIILNNGNDMAFPAYSITSPTSVPIDATTLFESATLQSGFLDLTIHNGFPIDIDTVVFELRNNSDNFLVSTDTFTDVLAGTDQTKSIDLSGKHVEGHMTAKIVRLYTPGSNGNPVHIDTSDAIVISFQAHDMVVETATALFPAQNLIDEDQETTYNVDGGAKLTKIRVQSGQLKLVLNSSLHQQSYFTYTLPSASLDGNSNIVMNETLPPAPPGGSSSITRYVNLAGYEIDMRGANHLKYNTIVNHLVVRMDSSLTPVTLSSADSVFIDYGLTSIVPSYVEGYLGQQIIEVGTDTAQLPLFHMIKSGQLGLKDVDVSLGIENSLGAEGRITIYDLKSIRSNTGNVVSLASPTVMNQPLFIPRATDNPLTPANASFALNTANSNIKPWLENIPDKVAYRMDVFMNPNGNSANYHDFAYNDTRIKLNMNVQMPLSLLANDLVLADTIGFSGLGNKVNGLQDLQLKLTTTNGFPLSTDIKIVLLDENKFVIGDLTNAPLHVNAGTTNGDCVVQQPAVSELPISVPKEKITWLRNARYAAIQATFNTEQNNGCNDYLKIFDTYKLQCKLTGAVTYDVTP